MAIRHYKSQDTFELIAQHAELIRIKMRKKSPDYEGVTDHFETISILLSEAKQEMEANK